jgi:glycosyltransferase involved in cell wall biosynthesis
LKSLSIILPTRNCLQELLATERELFEWLEYGTEVICVDSHSTDGTREWLQSFCANHPSACLIDHPPGLYASWNAGILQSSGDWIHIATAGDTVLADGGSHLLEVGQNHSADIVISPPRMQYSDLKMAQVRWPVHDMVESLCNDNTFHELDSKEKKFWFFAFLPSTPLGSSASNLYRGSFLRSKLFPTNAGHAGDSLWALKNANQAKIILTSKVCARFNVATSGSGKEESAHIQWGLFSKSVEFAREMLVEYHVTQAEKNLLDSVWGPKIELWEWLASIEKSEIEIKNVLEEQLSYISILEKERVRLLDEVERLSKVPLTDIIPPIKMSHISSLMRGLVKLKRKLWNS